MWKVFIIVSLFMITGGVMAADAVNVTGNQAIYSADGKQAEFSGNVVVSAGGVTVYADKLAITVGESGNHYVAEGAPVRVGCADCGQVLLSIMVRRLQLDDGANVLSASGGITICAGENCVQGNLVADSGNWSRGEQRAQFMGAPVRGKWLQDDEKIPTTIRARQVDYDIVGGDIAMRGGALLARDGNDIRSEFIHFNIKNGELRADGGDGRVRATFGGDE
ncbi:hypothetical protein NQX30_03655 [Candidatus Persebacteraceae bacterium Df01]|uniref:Organic solvent tolerance-like N-terminal domain-containing protein n=1 Tax=Candidatus Doriopsillibacter californiensis TaxID=2970740 RepID=A0ABT7QLI9_9GAMM|nr:hypothetical protein [Candidatus Persebacteraceae bacterium Df01]